MPVKKKATPEQILSQKAKLFTPSRVAAGLLFVYLMFLSWQVARTGKKFDEFADQGQQAEQEQVEIALPTQGLPRATLTPVMLDPNKTPIVYNSEMFVYTGFEVAYRGVKFYSCPSRTVSVRNVPNISGEVVGCLPPYSVWNIEKPYVYDGYNVWGALAMQVDEDGKLNKWIPLLYNGVYFTNWHGGQ